ncbi:ABC transporter ATP-binding protein [Acuticoccus kandeliae]|uniref:ABC transporter ATP-binding protein n=1 Tax=Acuticoccus kandeliae TaxID=2073160 RepID=UPI000D3ED074|nr:ABC transporter ATP-binding protein [Acuticoccus kandeliae]
MDARPLYRFILRTSRRGQVRVAFLTSLVTPLAFVPLEIQRRFVETAVGSRQVRILAILGAVYLAVLLVQGTLKYFLNVTKGEILEEVTRDLRRRVVAWEEGLGSATPRPPIDEGTRASMIISEAEDVGGFASDSIALPLLQAGTILWVLAYLFWIEWPIAVLAMAIYAPQALIVPRVQATINRMIRMKTLRVRRLGDDVGQMSRLQAEQRLRLQIHAAIAIDNVFLLRMMIYRRKYFLTALGNFLDALGPLMVLMVGGTMVIRGETDVATLVVFISGFQKIADPWDVLVNFFRTVSNAVVTFDLLMDTLEGRTVRRAHPVARRRMGMSARRHG